MDDRGQISGLVREHLGRHSFDGISMEVLEDRVRRERTWWYVPIQPSHSIENISRYYELLAEVEEELLEERNLDVLLVPTLPDA